MQSGRKDDLLLNHHDVLLFYFLPPIKLIEFAPMFSTEKSI